VRLAIHVLLEEAIAPLAPKQMELLLDARENTERLLKIIESLLALARLEDQRRALMLQPEDPLELLRRAADAVASRAADRQIEVVVGEAFEVPRVAVDLLRFEPALGNLLDNALAFTPRGGRVTLSVSQSGPDQVQLSIADTGVGIPPEALPHLFEKFYRVPGRSGPGTGLGLAITREIARAHGGDVTCESQPGHGTTFHITLPVWKG
jgi:signal transduction histidine kinase